jgi:outer membrane biosynthesis protein TonB
MASTFYDGFERNAARGAIDLPVAALAAVSVGFVAFAMPSNLFDGAIAATGLPSLLSAAQPPLGSTARLLVVAVAAIATFASVFALLRLLDRRGAAAPARAPARSRMREVLDEVEEVEVPRLRRADHHPDAPARRPILAGSELGEPNLARPYPQRRPPEPEPEPEPQPEPEPEIESQPEPEPEPEPEAAIEPEFIPEPEPVAAPAPVSDSSISDLVARLERGLERRQHAEEAAPETSARPDPAAPEAAPAAPERDDRLRSAIENLQRLASKA